MRFGESISSRKNSSNNKDQYGSFLSSSKIFLHNQRLSLLSSSCNTFIDEAGPFWPIGFPIKYPSPSHISRSLPVDYFNEYYHFLDTIHQQTYDNQPAIYKYTGTLKHSMIAYDMEKSSRQQQIKSNDNENICPQLIFESRFEGGNLRQVKRV
jgi:hypothetical protein